MKNKYNKKFVTLLIEDIKQIDGRFLLSYNQKTATNISNVKKLQSSLIKEMNIFYIKNKNMPFFRFTAQIKKANKNFFLTLCEINKTEIDKIIANYRISCYK